MQVCIIVVATWFMTVQPVLCCLLMVSYSKCVGCRAVNLLPVLCYAVLFSAVLFSAVLHCATNYPRLVVNHCSCASQAAT